MIEIPTSRIEEEIGTKELKRFADLVCTNALPQLKPGITFETASFYKLKNTGKYYSVLGFFKLNLTGPNEVRWDLCGLLAARNIDEHLLLKAVHTEQKKNLAE